jgi:hypothetical protein
MNKNNNVIQKLQKEIKDKLKLIKKIEEKNVPTKEEILAIKQKINILLKKLNNKENFISLSFHVSLNDLASTVCFDSFELCQPKSLIDSLTDSDYLVSDIFDELTKKEIKECKENIKLQLNNSNYFKELEQSKIEINNELKKLATKYHTSYDEVCNLISYG